MDHLFDPMVPAFLPCDWMCGSLRQNANREASTDHYDHVPLTGGVLLDFCLQS